jgi:hypothetical protein
MGYQGFQPMVLTLHSPVLSDEDMQKSVIFITRLIRIPLNCIELMLQLSEFLSPWRDNIATLVSIYALGKRDRVD